MMIGSDLLQHGDLLFFSGSTLWLKLIQKVTDSEWSHVAIALKLKEYPGTMVLESKEWYGVRLIPLSAYKNYKGQIWRAVDWDARGNKKGLNKAVTWGLNKLGNPYNWTEIEELAQTFLFKTKRTLHISHRSFICSVFVWEFMKQWGYQLSAIPLESPGDISKSQFLIDWTQIY